MSAGMRMLVVSLGGILGANARYWLGLWLTRWLGSRWPWSTLVINVTGSLAIGFLAGVFVRHHPHSGPRLLLIVGFLGSYTTFSSFSLEAMVLWEQGRIGAALGYQAASVAAGFAAALLGATAAGLFAN